MNTPEKSSPTDDDLKAAWRARQRVEDSSPPDVEDVMRATAPGVMPEEERLALLDRALSDGSAGELALAFHVQEAATRAAQDADRKTSLIRRWPIGIAAVLTAAAALSVWQRAPSGANPDELVRGESANGRPTLIAPSEDAAMTAGTALVWRAMPDAIGYRVDVVDARGASLWSERTTDTTALVLLSGETERRAAQAWSVTVFRRSGDSTRSMLRAFARE